MKTKKESAPFITGGMREKERMLLRYTTLAAKDDQTTEGEKSEMSAIEDHLHLSGESILRRVKQLAVAHLKNGLSPAQEKNFKIGANRIRVAVEEIEARQRLH